jgi:hypothetical protein
MDFSHQRDRQGLGPAKDHDICRKSQDRPLNRVENVSTQFGLNAHDAVALGFGNHLVTVLTTGCKVILPSFDLQVLAASCTSDTVEGLVRRALESFGQFDDIESAAIENSINKLIRMDLIVPTPRSIGIGTEFKDAGQNSIVALVFPTEGRSQELKRAVSSYASNCRSFGRTIELIIMDDSNSDWMERNCAQLLEGQTQDFPLRFGGHQQKRAYVEELVRRGIDREAAEFSILGSSGFGTAGANRNSISLDTFGDCIFSADDDTTCDTVSHPERSSELVLSGHTNPREFWFYSDRDQIYRETCWEPLDLLAEHELLLGNSILNVLGDGRLDAISFDHACTHVLQGLQPNLNFCAVFHPPAIRLDR